jgi:polyhydroxyalkanoate synthesis repressor PhaR
VDTNKESQSSSQAAADRPKRIIKRYSNRKLYDTKDSRYVTLLQIAEMVRGGEEVQIIDNNSKEDLTEVTLAQIIYEEKKANSRTVPLQTLKELIHQRTEKVLSDLREGPIGRLIPGAGGKDPKTAEGTGSAEGAGGTATPATDVKAEAKGDTGKNASFVDHAKETLEDFQHKVDERIKAVLPSVLPWQQLQHEVKRLNARIEELEQKLKKNGGS